MSELERSEGFLERTARLGRNVAMAAGMGATALGAIIKDPETAGIGLVSLAVGGAFEGARRYLEHGSEQPVVTTE